MKAADTPLSGLHLKASPSSQQQLGLEMPDHEFVWWTCSKKRGLCVVRAIFQAAPDLAAKIAPWLRWYMPKRMLRLASDCSAGLGDSVAVVSRIATSWDWHCGRGVGGDSSLQSLPSASRVFPWTLHSSAKITAV